MESSANHHDPEAGKTSRAFRIVEAISLLPSIEIIRKTYTTKSLYNNGKARNNSQSSVGHLASDISIRP